MAAAEKSEKKGEGSIVIALVAVTVIAAAVGGGVGYFLLPVGEDASAAKTAVAAKPDETAANEESGDGAKDGDASHASAAHGETGHGDTGHGAKPDAKHGDAKHGDAHKAPAKAAPGAITVKELPAIVTNLADGDSKWIRLQAAIVYDPAQTPHAEKLIAEITSDVTEFLRTLHVSSLEGADGLRRLQEELSERAEIRSERKVRELIIETMVVQ